MPSQEKIELCAVVSARTGLEEQDEAGLALGSRLQAAIDLLNLLAVKPGYVPPGKCIVFAFGACVYVSEVNIPPKIFRLQ